MLLPNKQSQLDLREVAIHCPNEMLLLGALCWVCVCAHTAICSLNSLQQAAPQPITTSKGGPRPGSCARHPPNWETEATAQFMNPVVAAATPHLQRHPEMANATGCLLLHSPCFAKEPNSSFRSPSFPASDLHSKRLIASAMSIRTSLVLIVPSPTEMQPSTKIQEPLPLD